MGTQARRFRELLAREPYVFTSGVYSPLDAQIAERAGLKAVYMSGYSVSMLHGWPDMGFLTMTEVTRMASHIAGAVEVPVIADADDGYGSALNTLRTVQEFVKTGVAGIHLEDQQYPKRCGHIAGKTILPFDEAVGKFRAAVDERDRLDPDLVLIARTDALAIEGLERALARAR
ncbi:MAG: isocitrate lyase/PEP mutase family protein, partial [Candidatus Rokubacteria bacterium]|nr:isocitrate lyase/PEP mutase family protein [Candidatus Rokubacteria bacterium]